MGSAGDRLASSTGGGVAISTFATPAACLNTCVDLDLCAFFECGASGAVWGADACAVQVVPGAHEDASGWCFMRLLPPVPAYPEIVDDGFEVRSVLRHRHTHGGPEGGVCYI